MELEFKGTKYEWKYLPYESKDRTHTVREIKAEGTSICIVRTNNQDQAESNAKLIASAPDLLEALINLTNTCEKYFSKDFDLREAKKAIEKAIK